MQQFGVTPVELAQTQRLLFSKKLLQETTLPMVDVAFAAGFGSVRRFNALFAARYRMAPSAVRRAGAASGASVAAPGADSLTLGLAYRPPFDWPRMLAYLAGRAMPGLEAVLPDDGRGAYVRSVRLGDAQGWIATDLYRASGTPLREGAGSMDIWTWWSCSEKSPILSLPALAVIDKRGSR
jgi:AraC family transcriptional regulator of adaptative response / DNA-3-methyladenine glycosylase II